MAQQISSKGSEPSFVEQIDIYSNSDSSKSVSLTNGFAGLTYT